MTARYDYAEGVWRANHTLDAWERDTRIKRLLRRLVREAVRAGQDGIGPDMCCDPDYIAKELIR